MKKSSLLKCQRFCYLFAALLLLSFESQAQSDTTFWNRSSQIVYSKDQAYYYRVVSKKATKGLFEVKDINEYDFVYMKGFSLSHDSLIEEGKFTYFHNGVFTGVYHQGKREGIWKMFYVDGKLHWVENYKMGERDGEFIVYNPSGSIRRKERYASGKFLTGKCFNEKGKEVPYFAFETMPEFYGGDQGRNEFISNEVRYPEEAIKKKIQGRVIVKFAVNEKGELEDVFILKSVHELLDKEALRVMQSMPKWKPGTQDGKPVKVYYTLPLSFQLD